MILELCNRCKNECKLEIVIDGQTLIKCPRYKKKMSTAKNLKP